MKYALLIPWLLIMGCTHNDTGTLHGDFLVVHDCRDGIDVLFQPYEMDGNFFSLQHLGNIAFIRMQPGGQPLHRSDALVIQVSDPQFIKQRIGQRIYLDNPLVRATLHVMDSCPNTTQSMTADEDPGDNEVGHITFSKFGIGKGDEVAAVLVFDLRDERTGEMVGLGFEASFEFTVKVGQPYQPFSGTIK
jgi:hypothetical protein